MNIVHIMNISIYKFSSDSNGQWSIFINNLNWKPIVVKNLIEQTLYKLFVHPLERPLLKCTLKVYSFNGHYS